MFFFLFLCDKNQVMVALVGAAVFHGAFYPQCHIVQLRVEYLVTGPEVAQVRKRVLLLCPEQHRSTAPFTPNATLYSCMLGTWSKDLMLFRVRY